MTILQVEEILRNKVDLNHFIILTMIYQKQPVETLQNVKVQGWLKMMMMKQLISQENGKYLVTEEGLKIIKNVGLTEIVVKAEEKLKLTDLMKTNTVYDYDALHKRLKEELKKLTGNSQYFLKVQGNTFPYIPGVTDLRQKLEKFKMVYKLTDMDKIERCLMRHLSIRNQKMIYYIMRERGDAKSDLAGDYENIDDLTVIKNTNNNKTTDI